MPRYVVERTFPEGLNLPMDETGAEICRSVVSNPAWETLTRGSPSGIEQAEDRTTA